MNSNGTAPPTRRTEIGQKLKALREARRWSQTELAERVGISQARISLIEHGKAALDAGEFLDVLRIFNVPASHFERPAKDHDTAALQNALVRLGARHLFANDQVIPSDALNDPAAVIKEVLATGTNPRQITALSPVIVIQLDRINASKLWSQFVDYGLQQRLGWLLENTVLAIHEITPKVTDRTESAKLRKAETFLSHFLSHIEPQRVSALDKPQDILGQVFSKKTLENSQQRLSDVSRRWSILTKIKPHDFTEALEAALDTH